MDSLNNIKILDFTQAMAGPIATMVLSDLGADVIKVEPLNGEQSRHWAPPYINSESAYYLSLNRNKSDICMDLKSSWSIEIIKKLAKNSDIIIENFRPGVAKKLNIDYETLKKYNDKIIYCSISGFGQTGPDKDKPAYDLIALARSGLMGITGEKNGEPVKFGVPITDITSGLFAAISILSALYYREKTGRGQYIDLSMLDVNVFLLVNQFMNYIATGKNPEREGSKHPSIVPYQVFKAMDDYIAIAVGTDKLWSLLCSAINRKDLINNEKFDNNENRLKNRDELINIINNELSKIDVADLINTLNDYGVPCSKVNRISDVVEDKQINFRDMIRDFNGLKLLNSPIKMSETPGKIRKLPSKLGEDTYDILKNLGYTDQEIKAFKDNGTVK